jgi:hypothetical protein
VLVSEPNREGLESANLDLQSLFKKPGGATAQPRARAALAAAMNDGSEILLPTQWNRARAFETFQRG